MGTVVKKEPSKQDLAEKAYRDLEVLNDLAFSVHQSLLLEDVLRNIVEKISEIFKDVTGVEVYLLANGEKTLFLKTQRGLSPEYIGTGTLQIGEGLAGYIVDNQTPLFLGLLAEDERVDAKMVSREKLSSYGGIPLLSEGKVLGVLGVYTRVPRIFSEEEQQLFTEMGHWIGAALRNALTHEQAAMRARRFITISRAITVTRQLGTLDKVLQDITKVLVQSLGFDQSWIGLVEDETNLQGKVGFGEGMRTKGVQASYSIGSESHNPAVRAVLEQKPVIFQFVEDVPDDDFKIWLRKLEAESFGYVPILSGEKALGVIGIFHVTDKDFEEEDVKTLISVAEQAAIAIENAQLYEQIKTSEVRYRTLFEAAGTSFVIVDENQGFRLVNHAFETLSGYNRDELIGEMTLSSFFMDRGQGKKKGKSLGKPPQSWETPFTDKEGVVKQVHVTTTQIPGSSDILVSLIDMTRERELERCLFRSEELAAIGELSAGIAHEIRNPLVAITNSVSLLKDEPRISQEGQQLLDVVKEESDHLAAIVDDFLRFARPKKPTFQEEDINQLLKDVVKRHKDWNEKQVKWVERYDNDLPLISLDRHQIQQIITNLLLNGLDAVQEGGVLTIETQREKRMSNEYVRFIIADSGEGIPEAEVSKIFQPFYSTKEKGTGMGLAICRRIVNNHGGDIFVDSELNVGTNFSVVLPISRESKEQ